MLCTLLFPRLSFLTLVMAPFALKRCCGVFSVRLDIVAAAAASASAAAAAAAAVVVVVVCKLWLSALSHLCLNKMPELRQQGKKAGRRGEGGIKRNSSDLNQNTL